MVLARERAATVGDLRYYADTVPEAFATPMAAANLGRRWPRMAIRRALTACSRKPPVWSIPGRNPMPIAPITAMHLRDATALWRWRRGRLAVVDRLTTDIAGKHRPDRRKRGTLSTQESI